MKSTDWTKQQELTIDMSEFAFTPKEFALTAGQPYVLSRTLI